MNRSVTVSTRGALVALVVALALATAYLLGSGGGGAAQAAPTSTAVQRPGTLVTTGTGQTIGVPDELAFSVSVGLVRPTLTEALAAANGRMRAVMATLARLGVARPDVQTTGLHMNAVYDYHPSSPPTLRGYRVSQSAQVLVRQLGRGGAVVGAVVRSGGNDVRVGALSLRIADPEALLARSRAAAVKAAAAKAREYAAAAGQSLGGVRSLREVRASAPPSLPLARAPFATDSVATVPVRAGRDRLAVTVRVVWTLR